MYYFYKFYKDYIFKSIETVQYSWVKAKRESDKFKLLISTIILKIKLNASKYRFIRQYFIISASFLHKNQKK